jgi:hypothetical protein
MTTSTWSGFANEVAVRSNVASSKAHFGEQFFEMSFAKASRFFA